ncbi:MAG: hypothetical protein AB7P31_08820 [Steroidobacteraceae bacterium]
MAKPNFRHQKLQRERDKKARQLEKEQRRMARNAQEQPPEGTAPPETPPPGTIETP